MSNTYLYLRPCSTKAFVRQNSGMVRCGEKCRNFGLAIYNPKEKKFFGRTCSSWSMIWFWLLNHIALIFVYYLIFYSCLAGFWIGMLSVLIFAMINTKVPALTGMQSLLKLNPGVSNGCEIFWYETNRYWALYFIFGIFWEIFDFLMLKDLIYSQIGITFLKSTATCTSFEA